MITDLRYDLDKSSVNAYIDSFVTELDKLHTALARDSSLGSQAQADIVMKLKNYAQVTKIHPGIQLDEVPPRNDENPE